MLLKNILEQVKIIDFSGNKDTVITSVAALDDATGSPDTLFWCSDKNLHRLAGINAGTVILSKNADRSLFKPLMNYIVVENPRLAFREVLEKFFVEKQQFYVSHSAIVHVSVRLGSNVFIGENVVIEEGVVIGNNVVIQHNTVIFRKTEIGNNVVIGANNTIGGVGFGYEKDSEGEFQLIPHIGNVVLKDYVEIGNNTCIDRAVMGSTILCENVKVDNLVHIAHGVKIGRNSVVIANAMVAGSVEIGENNWIAPSASILNQKKTGKNVLVGMGAVVLKDAEDNDIVVGNPGKVIKKNN